MKILSLWQPWASLIAWGEKQVETRSWATDYRGLIAIHATAKVQAEAVGAVELSSAIMDALGRRADLYGIWSADWKANLETLPAGAVVAVARIKDCRYTAIKQGEALHEAAWMKHLTDRERAFGDYSVDRYGWFLTDIRPLKNPVPCRGSQGLRDLPADITALVEEQL